MNKIVAILVMTTFLPVQAYAAVDFNFDPVEQELLHAKAPVIQQENPDTSRFMDPPPSTVVEKKSETNWWIWGTVGLAVLVGGGIALAAGGGGKGGGSTTGGGGTSTVTGSW